MADIDIQRKEGQPAWVWIAAVVGVLVLAGIIWAVMSNRDDHDDAQMRRDTIPAARDTPVGWLEHGRDAVPDYLTLLG
jgi:hypothetical protein